MPTTRLLILPLLLTAPLIAFAQGRNAAPPFLYSSPAAAQPGASTDLTFFNAPSGTPTVLWTSTPSESTPLPDPKAARFRLTLPPDAPIGIHTLRLATSTGLSSVGLFMVDDLPTLPRAANNHTPVDAQPLPPLCAVDAATDPLASDFYRFRATRGQRIAFEVVAQRLGSRMDPLVRLLDPAGRDLAYVDDTPGLGADIRFAHTFTADGDYLLELRDANYDGSADHRYRLRVGDFPVVTAPFPLAARRGAGALFDFLSPTGDRLGPIAIQLPADAPRGWCSLKHPGGRSSAFVPLLVTDRDEFVPTTRNHTPDSAARITFPTGISGHLAAPGARHFYELAGKKGDRIALRGKTRSLGSPVDLFFQILKPDGSTLAESKFVELKPPTKGALPPPPDEGTLDVTLPADGLYRLCVEDLTRAGGPAMVYHLDVDRLAPDFALSVDTDKIDTTAGTTFRLKVKADRRGYDGSITLALTGPAATFPLKNNTIGKGKSETDLEVTAPTPVPLAQFTVVGAGTSIPPRIASTTTVRKFFPRITFLPPELDGPIGLRVRATPTHDNSDAK